MKKRILIIIYTIFTLFSFTIILAVKVHAIETQEHYTNYYFFLEAYVVDNNDPFGSTINYTAFPPLTFGVKSKICTNGEDCSNSNSNSKIISFKESCDDGANSNDCWNYSKFYEKYIETEIYGTEVGKLSDKIDTQSYYKEADGKIFIADQLRNVKYYTHGGYWAGTKFESSVEQKLTCKYGETCSEDVTAEESIKTNLIAAMTCASISKVNNNEYKANWRVVDFDGDNYTFLEKDAPDIDSNTAIFLKIYRPSIEQISFASESKVLNPSEDLSNPDCNNIITPLKVGAKNWVFSPILLQYNYTITTNKCDVIKPVNDLSCNGNLELKSTCDTLTVTNEPEEAATDVSINQTGYVSNLLTPRSLYNGGGFKFGIVYKNEISWEFKDKNKVTDQDQIAISDKMNLKIKSKVEFESDLTLNNISFGEKTIDSSFFKKECSTEGTFEAGKTLTTTCTFFLPNAKMNPYTGNIGGYGNSYNINNKYYIPLDYNNPNYQISATLSNMSMLKDNDAIADSPNPNEGKPWTGDWTVNIGGDSCNINIYNGLPKNFAAIYRPIDLNNPFPGRNAGINWYDWINIDNNKERLKETYTRTPYSVSLDNDTIADIKTYNEDQDKNNNGYLGWDGIDKNGESSFVTDYVERGDD